MSDRLQTNTNQEPMDIFDVNKIWKCLLNELCKLINRDRIWHQIVIKVRDKVNTLYFESRYIRIYDKILTHKKFTFDEYGIEWDKLMNQQKH